MKHTLTSADNKQVEIECIGCALVRGEIETVGGLAYESELFTLAQDWEIPIEGFFIIGSKRHFRGFGDMTKEESGEYQTLLIQTRTAMKEVLGIDKVTVIQEEKSLTSHFHVWLFPWHTWMEEIGTRLSHIEGIMEHARSNMKDEENLRTLQESVEMVGEYLKVK